MKWLIGIGAICAALFGANAVLYIDSGHAINLFAAMLSGFAAALNFTVAIIQRR